MTLQGSGWHRAMALGLLLVSGACAAPPSPYATDAPDAPANPRRSTGSVGGVRQLAEQDGWYVLLNEAGQQPVCLVVRPAIDTDPPTITGAYGVSGEGGFYMYIPRNSQVAFFGFYGTQPYGDSRAEVDGERIRYTNDRDTVLGWEGRQVAFQVWSDPAAPAPEIPLLGQTPLGFAGQNTAVKPTRELGDDAVLTSGEVDFSGVTSAYQALLDCHAA